MRWFLGTCVVLAVVFHASEAVACSPRMPADRWDKQLGNKVLAYTRNDRSRGSLSVGTLKLYEGKSVKWSVPMPGRSLSYGGDGFEVSPNGKLLARVGRTELLLIATKDGATKAEIDLVELLTEAERVGGTTELWGDRRYRSPCGDDSGGIRASINRHEWKKNGELTVVMNSAVQLDGAAHPIELEVDAAGTVKRKVPAVVVSLRSQRARYAEAKTEDERRRLLTILAWSAGHQESLDDPQSSPFFLEVARDLEAPPDFLRLAVAGLWRKSGAPNAIRIFDAAELFGRDAVVDDLLLQDSPSWTPLQQHEALAKVLVAKDRTGEQRKLAFVMLSKKLHELGDVARLGAASPDPELRAAVLARILELPPSPEHLSAAITFLNGRDPALLDAARLATIANLKKAALKRHADELVAALGKQQIKPWPEGDLAIGEYLQASGQLGLAGGMFAAGVERTEDKPSTLRNELLSRLALNMLIRGKPTEAKAATTLLLASGGPLGGPLVCALSVPEVRVGVMAPCARKVPTKTQAEALSRVLEQAPQVPQ